MSKIKPVKVNDDTARKLYRAVSYVLLRLVSVHSTDKKWLLYQIGKHYTYRDLYFDALSKRNFKASSNYSSEAFLAKRLILEYFQGTESGVMYSALENIFGEDVDITSNFNYVPDE